MNNADIARLLCLAALWGGSFSFMRVVAPVFGGIGTMWLRIGIAGLVLLAYARITHVDLAFGKWWKQYLFIGLMNSALPFALFAFAMKTLPAGYGAILNGAAPFFAAIFAALMLKEKLSPPRMAGLLLGFAGVGVVMNLGTLTLDRDTCIAAAACIAATCSYGFIIVYTKKYTQGAPNMGIAVGTLLLPALLVSPLGVTSLPAAWPSTIVLFSLLGLAIFCSAIAYLLYFRLIRDVGPTKAITVTFLVPVFGVMWGALFFGESLNGGAMFGGVLVLIGVALVLEVVPRKRLQTQQ